MKEKKPESCKYPIAPDGKPIKNWKKGFPDGTDFTGVSFEDKNIYNVDFSKAKGLTWKQFAEASDICGVKLPDGIDFTGVSFKDKNIRWVDFSKAKGLSWKQLTRD